MALDSAESFGIDLSLPRRRGQVVRQRFAKPPFTGSNPVGAFSSPLPTRRTGPNPGRVEAGRVGAGHGCLLFLCPPAARRQERGSLRAVRPGAWDA